MKSISFILSSILICNFIFVSLSASAQAQPADTTFCVLSKFETTQTDKANLRGAVALSPTTDSLFNGTDKIQLSAKPYEHNGHIMFPACDIKKAFGIDTNINTDNNTITIGENAVMTVGSTKMSLDTAIVNLSTAPVINNEIFFVPLTDIAENILNKEIFHNQTYGMIIIADSISEYSTNSNLICQLYNYLFFDRKNADEIKEIYLQSQMADTHPRILATAADFNNIITQYKLKDKYICTWVDYILEQANELIAEPKLIDGTYSTINFEEYKTQEESNQLLWEARNTLQRIKYLSLSYQITKNSAYARRAADELVHVCGWNDWRHTNFLSVGEMAMAVAIGYDWCYSALTDDERTLMENALIKNALSYAIDFFNGNTYTSTDYTTANHNWNIVCNAGMIAASLAICDKYPSMSFRMIEVSLRSLETAMSSFAPDGGWGEGAMYWDYSMQYACYLFSSLKTGLATDFDIPDYKGFSDTRKFWEATVFNKGLNNYHDATSGNNFINSQWLLYIAQRFNNKQCANTALVAADALGGIIDKIDTPESCIWYSRLNNKSASNSDDIPLDCTVKGVEAGSMRSSWNDKNAFAIGFHGGWTSVNHYHIDSGSYILEMGGERFVSDLGSDDYSLPDYIGGESGIYRKRAEAHSLFVIDPSDDGGQNASNTFCEIIKTQSKENGAFQIMDLQNAYSPKTKSAKRGFMLTDNRKSIIVQDEFELAEGMHDVYWFVPTEADDITIADNNTAILTQNGVKAKVEIISDISDFKLFERKCAPLLDNISNFADQNQNENFKQLCVEAKNVSGKLKFAMRYTLLNSSYSELTYNLTSMENWEITVPNSATVKPIAAITSISDGICANEKILNYTLTDKNTGNSIEGIHSAIVGVYDGNNKLLSSEYIIQQHSDLYSVTVDASNNPKYLKLFLWQDISNMTPVTDCLYQEISH